MGDERVIEEILQEILKELKTQTEMLKGWQAMDKNYHEKTLKRGDNYVCQTQNL